MPGAWGDNAGNYNYGATGSQLFSRDSLLRAAGAVQMASPLFGGRYDPKNGVPWGDYIIPQRIHILGIWLMTANLLLAVRLMVARGNSGQ